MQDAKLAAAAGADFLGMIMWHKAKRAVSASTAKDIASLAADHGIKSVGVFVDESAQQIQSMCEAAGIHVAQLHGPQSREALFDLPESLQTIYVMNCDDNGRLQTPTPAQLAERNHGVLSRWLTQLDTFHWPTISSVSLVLLLVLRCMLGMQRCTDNISAHSPSETSI